VLVLYTANTGNGRRATIMLEECALPYALHEVEIGKGSTKPPALLKINPEGTIPTIVDPAGVAGKPVCLRQSTAILSYLAEKTGKLLPTRPALRPAMLEWMMFAATDIACANTAMYQTMMEFPQAATAAVSSFFRQNLIDFLRVCDRRLGECEYLSGDEYTIADVALFPVLVSRRTLIEETPRLDNLKRWGEKIAARPAVKHALQAIS
jgi:GSH-dependent disulfide-bond oxidoreductase